MLEFDISNQYKGTGVSQGLDRGLLVYKDDELLLEEGMGMGACAFQTGGYTYFTSIKNIKKIEDKFEVICSIDKKLEIEVLGIKSKLFTRAQEYIVTNLYMKLEKRQEQLLKIGALIRKLLNVKQCYVKVLPLGEVRITYEIVNNDIFVDFSCETKQKVSKLFVMNELGGSLFDKSIIDGELLFAPTGWQKVENSCELFSPIHSLKFTIEERHVPDNVTSNLYWGREHVINNSCWAGFESEITSDSNIINHYTYAIKFREVAI